jgi:hypothetical protein
MPAHDEKSSFTKDLTAQLEQARFKGLDAAVRACALPLGIRPGSKSQLAHINSNALSTGFLLSVPDVIGTFTPDQFLVVFANYLGEPCPIFSRLQGQFIAHCTKSRCVDAYGDEIAAMATLPGDHRRQMHNEIARVVGNFVHAAGIPFTREPQNMFESGIPAEPCARWKASGGNQNIVPDMLLNSVPSLQSTISGGIGLGMHRDAILDFKTVANCKTRYGRRWKGSRRKHPDSERAVEVTHRNTLTEYRLRAEKMDRDFADVPATPQNVPGARAPLLVNWLPLKLTMLFRLSAAISGR